MLCGHMTQASTAGLQRKQAEEGADALPLNHIKGPSGSKAPGKLKGWK